MLTPILSIWTPDNGDDYALVQDLATIADDVEGAILNPPYIRITGTGDASLASTTHGFQVGPTAGLNIIADGDEIMARNAGATTTLYINNDGGDIRLGNETSDVRIPGRVVGTHYPWAQAAGVASISATLAQGAFDEVTVTFPAGRFTANPIMSVSANNVRYSISVLSLSTTGATFRYANWSTGNATSGGSLYWVATQMTSTTGAG